MALVLIINVFLAGFVCFAVIGGLASSIAPERAQALHRRSRRAGLRRGTTATPMPAEVGG
ncbi:MAG: hypothetical protein ACLPY3_13005 [Solirubrobacteraceae bacterium]